MEGCRRNPPKVLSVGCCDQPTLFHKVIIPAAVGDETTDPPLPGKYRNVLLVYETTENAYLYSSDGIPTLISDKGELKRLEKLIKEEEVARKEEDEKLATAIENEAKAREDADDALDDAILDEIDARIEADEDIWTEIRTIEAASDVVDVVGTYAELEAYDTSKLHDNDLIKVLQDETHGDAITYYRWSTATETFSYVGEQGPYYTQAQTDTLLDGKQNVLTAGDNINISNDVISATDTTYTAGTGLTLTGTEFAVDTTVIAEKSDLPTKTSDLTNDGADGTSTYVEADELAAVATSGDYSDLINTPTIPTVNDATLTITQGGATLGTFTANSNTDTTIDIVAASYTAGTGIDITNSVISVDNTVAMVSDIPTATSDLTNDSGFITSSDLPTKTSDLTNDGSDGTSTYVEASDLATVATSGSYTDLSNTPTIPTVNDATLTITQNGTSAGTFTANSSTNTTIALTDTTYSAFTGTDGTAAGTAGLVPAPATTDAGKFLKADGTWDTAGGGTSWAGSKVYYGTISGYSTPLKTVTVQNDFTEAVGNIMVLWCSGQNIFENSGSTSYRIRINGANTTDWVSPTYSQDGRWEAGNTITLVCFAVDSNGVGSWNLGDMSIANTDFYGEVKIGSGYTSNSSATVPTNAQLYDVYTIANGKQDALTAGTGINIDASNVISASVNNINSTDWDGLWQ